MSTDLPLTTCAEAAERYGHGVDRLLDGDPDAAEAAFQSALETDPGFALAYAGLAISASDPMDARAAIGRARQSSRGLSRRERHHVAIIELILDGRVPRASALGREHLMEFPRDAVVLHVLAERSNDLDDLLPS